MFDPEACVWAAKHGAHYVGMMGCAGKNDRVHELVLAAGATEDDWARVKRPIGLKFGAKTPAELAIAIVGELVDVRYRQRLPIETRAKHEKQLGQVDRAPEAMPVQAIGPAASSCFAVRKAAGNPKGKDVRP